MTPTRSSASLDAADDTVDGPRIGQADRHEPVDEPGTADASNGTGAADAGFSVKETIGGPLGIVESVTPTLVFMVAYMIVRSVAIPVIAASVVSLGFCVYRLTRRQKVRSALMGLLLAAVCALAALMTGDARNYYAPGFVVNSFWLAVLLLSLALRTPGLGLIIQVFNQPLEGGFSAWRRRWTQDPALYRAYRDATWLWAGLFAIRLVVEIPLWALHLSTALGVARLLTGVPLFALVVWLTWLIVAPTVTAAKKRQKNESAHKDPQAKDTQTATAGTAGDIDMSANNSNTGNADQGAQE